MSGKCEHGLTTKECLTCASPKHGAPPDPAQPEPADEFVKTMGGQFALVIAEIWHAHPDYGIRQTLDELNRRFPAPQPEPLTDEQIDAGVAAWFATTTSNGEDREHPFRKRMRAAIERAIRETTT